MPFIGKLPDVGAFRLIDSITTSATDTYALQVEGLSYFPSSARNLIVSLNGVTQAPESAYTVSGSNIVFASALTASDVIDYILVIGESVDIGTPSDNTVGNAQLKSDLDFSGKTLTFSADQISGDAINGGTISNFASTGIDDNATSPQFTIGLDDAQFFNPILPLSVGLTVGANASIRGNLDCDGFTSNGIDDNAESTAITIDSSQNVSFSGDLTVDTNTLYVDSTNNRVGISDDDPQGKLTIDTGSIEGINIYRSSSVANFGAITFKDTTNSNIQSKIGFNTDTLRLEANRVIECHTDSALSLKILDGNVGIGTSTFNLGTFSDPTLAVGSGASGTRGTVEIAADITTNTAYGILSFTNDSSTDTTNNKRVAQINATRNGNNNAADIDFITNDGSSFATRMKIKADGNVGIGITNPTSGNLVVATDSRSLGGTITARTNFQGSGWVFGDVVGRFAFDADDGPQDYTGTIESVVSQGGNYPYKTDLIFTTQTNGNRTEKLRIQENGGISFNGDTAAANALDDYEEGTFTCFLRDDSGNTSTSTTSKYTKIGDIVHVFFDMGNMSTSGLNTNENIRLTMPFTNGSSGSFGSVKLDRIAFSTSGYVICRLPSSSATVRLNECTNGGFDVDLKVSAINVSGGSDINGQITYKVA